MFGHTVRLLVAISTFTIGLALVWVFHLIPHLETALVDRLFVVNDSDLNPANTVLFDSVEDTNQIYGLLIQQKFILGDVTKLIVLQSETTGCPMYEDEALQKKWGHSETFHQMVKKLMPEAEAKTLDDYLAKNETSEPLRVSNPGIDYVIMKDSDLQDAKFDFWTKFYKKYPNSSGIVFFSNVGFNDRHDQAFVYAGRSCGGLCGAGDYVLLGKVNGKWTILKEQGLWVS
jgi:hypothetical protein